MSIKRRSFLSMLGGAFAAPLMPSVSLGAATKAAYPASALHAAIYHAQSRVNFSVFSLANQLGLPLGQAEAVMTDMSKRGILGPLQGTTQAGTWARSNVWTHPMAKAQAAHEAAKANRETYKTTDDVAQPKGADLRPMMAHLQNICRSQGRALHPRCAALV